MRTRYNLVQETGQCWATALCDTEKSWKHMKRETPQESAMSDW